MNTATKLRPGVGENRGESIESKDSSISIEINQLSNIVGGGSIALLIFKLSKENYDYFCTDINIKAEQTEKITRDKAMGTKLDKIFHLANKDELLKVMQTVEQTKQSQSFMIYTERSMETTGWREGIIFPITPGVLAFAYRDITNLMTIEKELKHEKERLRIVSDIIKDAVIVSDKLGNIIYLSQAVEKITGWTSQDSIGKPIGQILRAYETADETVSTLSGVLESVIQNKSTIKDQITIYSKDNDYVINVEYTAYSVEDTNGESRTVIILDENTEEKRKLIADTSENNHYDVLTKIPNRLLFEKLVNQAILKAEESKQKLTLFFVDLDNFKTVNDTMGHNAGDILLKEVVKRMQLALRQGDVLARQGGDEFLILLPNLTEEGMPNVARRILEAIRLPFHINDQDAFVSGSIGIARFPLDGEDTHTLIQNADIAMYQAKAIGRDNYQIYTPEFKRRLLDRQTMKNDIQNALTKGEFSLYYQPQYSLSTNKLCGLEALIRWNHPERGLLMPEHFINIVDDCGLSNVLGEWVIRTACTQIKAWETAGHNMVHVSINISAKQFKQKGMIQTIKSILEETELKPEWLELEITESISMSDVGFTASIMQELKGIGVSISIDNFGVGLASLSYLSHASLNSLKIDRSFILNMETQEDNKNVVLSILQLAKNLGLNVVAGGVETLEQLDFLQNNQCDKAQGYLWSKPVPCEEVEKYIQHTEIMDAKTKK